MSKKSSIHYEDIFTPQGLLGDVSKNPNMDFLMNIFKIPRIWGVSGFGEWNVGQHTMAVAFLALYWSKLNKYEPNKRDRLVTLALVHDAHEAVIGDILPHFKTDEVRDAVDNIQADILNAFDITEDQALKHELKLLDMISFLYEIGQSKPFGRDEKRKKLLDTIYKKQKEIIIDYAKHNSLNTTKLKQFFKKMDL